MKKRIYLVLLSVIVIFFSCRDDSGTFEEQVFTHSEITNALRGCIKAASDSTLNALCVVDTLHQTHGYYYFDSKAYRIELPAVAKQVTDTLTAYGFGGALDTLVFNMNRAAEKCGNRIKSLFLDPLKNITFPNLYQTLHGGNSAITDYVKETKQNELLALLKTSILLEQFNALNVNLTWDQFQEAYYEITQKYSSVDIFNPAVEQVVDGFFKKMALCEEAIRKNPELRGDKTGWLFRVFASLDN